MELLLAFNPRAHVPASREREISIISTLHPSDAGALRACARRVWLAAGETLANVGDRLDTVWFPEDVIVSLADPHSDGRQSDIGLIGAEGLVCWQVLLGEDRVANRCCVELSGGYALAVPTFALMALCEDRPALRRALLAFVSRFWEQVVGSLTATLHGAPDVRLARWLLLYHDRLEGDTLAITHQRLSELLGVRRATITDWLHLMEGDRLLRCTRGRIAIRDRNGLIQLAGTAYSGVGGVLAAARLASPAP